MEKKPKQKKEGPLVLWSSTWHWHNHVRTHQLVYLNIQRLQLLNGRNDQWGVGCNSSFFWHELLWRQQVFMLRKISEINLLMLDQRWQHWLGCEFHFWWPQCQFIDERSGMWLKEACVVVFVPHGSWYFMQWQQKCCELHHECPCVHYHGCNIKGGHL